MTACLYCVHAATTTDRRGNPTCEHCREHVAPEMSDAVVSDLMLARHDGHAPMSDEEKESIRRNIDDAMGNPVAMLERLIDSLRPVRS